MKFLLRIFKRRKKELADKKSLEDFLKRTLGVYEYYESKPLNIR